MKLKPGSLPTAASPLADLLVKEFRTCQDLHYLIREERRAMLNHDQNLIDALSSQKLRLIEELGQLDLSVNRKIEDIGQNLVKKAHFNHPWTNARILAEYDRETSGRLSSLFEGILALKEKISAMDSVNQTLSYPAQIHRPQLLP
jgi:hypothetical protein